MKCPDCGFEIIAGTFCGQCGVRASVTTPARKTSVYKGKRKILLVVTTVAIIVIVILAGLVIVAPKPDQSSTPESSLNYLIRGYNENNSAMVVIIPFCISMQYPVCLDDQSE